MSPGRRPSAASWSVVPAYLLLSLALTWPVARDFAHAIPAVFGALDPLLQSFLLGWDWHALATAPARVFHLPIFHPHERALTYMDHLLGEAVVAWPIRLLTGKTAPAYNALVLASFGLSGWFTYRLCRGMGLSRGASFLGGLAFAFGPYRYANLGNLNQLQTQFLPLGLHLALRCHRRQRLRDLAGLLAVLVVQSAFGWYYFFHLALVTALVFGWEALRGRRGWPAGALPGVVLMGAVALALVLPLLWPYLEQQRAMPGFRRTIGMTALWSADVVDYFRITLESAWARVWPTGAQAYWPGFLAVPLALVGLWGVIASASAPVVARPRAARSSWYLLRAAHWLGNRARRWGDAGHFLLIGLAGWIFSLGPVLHVAGTRTPVPLPFAAAFFVVPGFGSMRAPTRFAVLVLLATAVLAAVGWDRLMRGRSPGGRRGLFVAALFVGILGAWPVGIPMTTVPERSAMPPVYAWLVEQADRDPMVEMPMPKRVTDEDPTHARRQAWFLWHQHPRIDGVSGFVPPDDEILRLVMQGFPRPGALNALDRRGARWVIVHYADYAPEHAAWIEREIAAGGRLVEQARFGTDAIYRLMPAGSAPGSQFNR
jgi:hypothetical protein